MDGIARSTDSRLRIHTRSTCSASAYATINEPAIYAAVLAVLLGYGLAGKLAQVHRAKRPVVAAVNAPGMG